MAVTADRVIVELEAKLDRYEANVRRAEQKFDAATRSIAADAKRLERDISASTGAIGAQFRSLAATVGAAFSVAEVARLADTYTRFTNQLKVAGLEGAKLAGVQDILFASAQRYGVQLEALGTLYSRGAQVSKELGASQAELLQFTNGVAAALKVQGGSAESAQGALLQLSQLLGTGTVRAEEFNSVNEGALPILKAVAQNIEAAGGSVAKLRNLVNDGKVSSAEFFRAFLAGSVELEKQAAGASLTIANSFVVLENALSKFVGEADQANGATAAISAALIALSENLDTVSNALAVLAAVLLGRFVAGMAASAAASTVAATAVFALQARAVGAATTMEALALTSTTAGRALLAAFGGPIGLAVTALAVGIGYVVATSGEATKATGAYARAQDESAKASQQAAKASERLASAHGQARVEALAAAKAEAENVKQKLASARASVIAAQAELARARAFQRAQNTASVGGGIAGTGTFIQGTGDKAAAQAVANKRAADNAVATLEKSLARIDAAINGREAPAVANVTPGKPKKTKGGAAGSSASEIAARFLDDLDRAQAEIAAARADASQTAEQRRAIDRQRVEADREAKKRDIVANKDYSAAQKERLLALNEQVAAERLAAIKLAELAEGVQASIDIQTAELADAADLLRLRGDLADTAKERRDIELRILDLQYREEKLRLEAVAASAQSTEAEKQIARRRLSQIGEQYDLRKQSIDRANESPLEKYRRRMNKTSGQIQEQAEQWVVDELESVQDALSSAIQKKIGVKDPILSGVIDLFIEQVILKPLAEAFANAEGGGGNSFLGGLVSSLGTLFGGRASGGHVLAGQTYRVNETGIEGFRPAGSGQIIPLGRMRGAGGGGVAIYQSIKVDAANSVTPDGFADYIVERTRKETTYIVQEATKRTNKGVPGRVAQFQRDGT